MHTNSITTARSHRTNGCKNELRNFEVHRNNERDKQITTRTRMACFLYCSTLHTQENTAEKIISSAVDSPSIQNKILNKYFYSFAGEILNSPPQSITILGLSCFQRASRGKEIGFALVHSSPHFHCPLCNFFNTSTGEHIRSIAFGSTVTRCKAHNRAPTSTRFFSFFTISFRVFCTKNLLLITSKAQGTAPSPKMDKAPPLPQIHNNKLIKKFTLLRKS